MLSLLWFRRDLRLEDNFSLFMALQSSSKIQPIFVFDENILARFKNPNDRRISFILDGLKYLNQQLLNKKSELLVFYGKPEVLIPRISQALRVKQVFAGKDYEPYGLSRDGLIAKQVDLQVYNDHFIIAPEKLLKDDKTPYKVFTPYLKKWLSLIGPLDYAEYTADDTERYANINEIKNLLAKDNIVPINLEHGVPGYSYIQLKDWSLTNLESRFNNFIKTKLSNYTNDRNFLDIDGTSCISPFIRFGQISIRKCYREALKIKGSEQWVNELAWRDFYAMLLYHYPEIVSLEMQAQYRNIKWSQDKELFAKFTAGETGYPIIDAAIRQLLSSGWMHNRARMIVASFMTKNLWLDWRLGEEFFAQHLMDYELSSNIGGWQWSASVGADAQPYFRIFNPALQAKRFDPSGNYVRKYLGSPLFSGKDYPAIVNYEESRKKAIENFKKLAANNVGKNYGSSNGYWGSGSRP
jgi:deoxyribodipyrimidine photo-lyase